METMLSIFPTGLGWFGLWGSGRNLAGLIIGHASEAEVRARAKKLVVAASSQTPTEADWNPGLRRRLARFADGERIDFDDCVLDLPELSQFQSRVIAAARKVRYGKTISYGELATEAGSPGAARAVGSVMANNRFPIIVPCHRVVASGGKIGGFSAPQGITLKEKMLELEANAIHAEPPRVQNARQIRPKKRDTICF